MVVVLALREIHHAHATPSDLSQHPVGPEGVEVGLPFLGRPVVLKNRDGRRLEPGCRTRRVVDQAQDGGAQRVVSAALLGEPGVSSLGGGVEGPIQERIDPSFLLRRTADAGGARSHSHPRPKYIPMSVS